MEEQKKFCKFCGESIDMSCVVCPKCGKQVENISSNPNPNVVINNTNMNQNVNSGFYLGKPKNKWVSFFLCLFTFCGHKFYEGKIGMGIVYLFTAGLFGIGWLIDLISILCKPNPYYV